MIDIHEAARMLGRTLCGKVPHVIGTSLRRKTQEATEIKLCVDINSDAIPDIETVIAGILQETGKRSHFHGYELHLHVGGNPQFAGS